MNIIEQTLEFLGGRKRAYQLTFQKHQPHCQYVLKDVMMRGHLNEPCPHTDPLLIGKWMGKQELALDIVRHIYLSPEEMFIVWNGVRTPTKESR